MTTNHNPSNIYNLLEILNKFYNSKKFIFISAVIVTILGLIYEAQKPIVYQSKALIEIGNLDVGNKSEPLSSTSQLIQELLIHFVHKKNYEEEINPSKLKIKPLQGRLIELKYASPSVTMNEKFLTNISNYAEKIHSDIVNKRKQLALDDLDAEIEFLDKEIEFVNLQYQISKEKTSNKIKLLKNELSISLNALELNIQEKIDSLENQLIHNDAKINNFQDFFIQATENLELLNSDKNPLAEQAKDSSTLLNIVTDYNSQIILMNNQKRQIEIEISSLKKKLSDAKLGKSDSESISFLETKINFNEEELLHHDINFSQEIFLLNLEKEQKLLRLNQELNEKFTKRTKAVLEVKSLSVKKNLISFAFLSFFIGLVLAMLLILVKDILSNLQSKLNQ